MQLHLTTGLVTDDRTLASDYDHGLVSAFPDRTDHTGLLSDHVARLLRELSDDSSVTITTGGMAATYRKA